MRPPKTYERIVNRTRYSVATAELLAGDDYWDGHNFERRGRNKFLYRTPKGAYFTVTLSQWQGESDDLTPCTLEEAIDLYEGSLTEHYEPYDVAFPTVKVIDG